MLDLAAGLKDTSRLGCQVRRLTALCLGDASQLPFVYGADVAYL